MTFRHQHQSRRSPYYSSFLWKSFRCDTFVQNCAMCFHKRQQLHLPIVLVLLVPTIALITRILVITEYNLKLTGLLETFGIEVSNSSIISTVKDTGNHGPATHLCNVSLTLLEIPELTTWLIGNYSREAMQFYASSPSTIDDKATSNTLNEEQGEIWLHRGFERLKNTRKKKFTNSVCANQSHHVVIISAYLHFNHFLYKQQNRQQHQRKVKRTNHQQMQQQQPVLQLQHHGPYSIPDILDLLSTRIHETNSKIHANRSNFDHIESNFITTITYVLAVPTWNPKRGNEIGLSHIHKLFVTIDNSSDCKSSYSFHQDDTGSEGSHIRLGYISLGFERNTYWQKVVSPSHVIPIPYVVSINSSILNSTPEEQHHLLKKAPSQLQPHGQKLLNDRPTLLFYAGDTRPNAVKWTGCNRTALLQPFVDVMNQYSNKSNKSSTDRNKIIVRLSDNNIRRCKSRMSDTQLTNQTCHQRLSMTEYNKIMLQSKYCLIVCGDTPTSRSLSSAIIHGCIPFFIGIDRWHGYCRQPVCNHGWGWDVLHNTTANPKRAGGYDRSQRPYHSLQQRYLSHFPYHTIFDYTHFPFIDEYELLRNKNQNTLARNRDNENQMQRNEQFSFETQLLSKLSNYMVRPERYPTRDAFIYGYDHPVTTQYIGPATEYIWKSIQDHLDHWAKTSKRNDNCNISTFR